MNATKEMLVVGNAVERRMLWMPRKDEMRGLSLLWIEDGVLLTRTMAGGVVVRHGVPMMFPVPSAFRNRSDISMRVRRA
jgi:hypothetical protein